MNLKIQRSAFFLIFSSLLLFAAQAFAGPAADTLARIRAENKLRFNDKGFINDPALSARFSASQNAAIRQLRAAGHLRRSIRVTNNLRSNLIITVSIVQETNGEFAGLLVERSRYNNDIEEASLRLFNIPILLNGITLLSHNGAAVVSIKSQHLTAQSGGQVAIKYPTNFKNRTYGEAQFDVIRSTAGDMSFFTTSRAAFTQVQVQLWAQLLAQNFGVERVIFR